MLKEEVLHTCINVSTFFSLTNLYAEMEHQLKYDYYCFRLLRGATQGSKANTETTFQKINCMSGEILTSNLYFQTLLFFCVCLTVLHCSFQQSNSHYSVASILLRIQRPTRCTALFFYQCIIILFIFCHFLWLPMYIFCIKLCILIDAKN